MDKEFVPYEPSLALKELGFDEPCLTYYFSDGAFNDAAEEDYTLHPGDPRFYSDTNSSLAEYCENELKYKAISAPTFSQAFRWFRKNHKLGAIVSQFGYGIEDEYGQIIYNIDDDEKPLCYEKAELACLIKLIEITNGSKRT